MVETYFQALVRIRAILRERAEIPVWGMSRALIVTKPGVPFCITMFRAGVQGRRRFGLPCFEYGERAARRRRRALSVGHEVCVPRSGISSSSVDPPTFHRVNAMNKRRIVFSKKGNCCLIVLAGASVGTSFNPKNVAIWSDEEMPASIM
jgi:hypothetical protein